MPQRQISPERKALFYIGMAVSVIGFLCFISTFFSSPSPSPGGFRDFSPGGFGDLSPGGFGDFGRNFEREADSSETRALIGMMMVIAGVIMTSIGRLGLAGSGVMLDPEKARRDVEPWSRMTGGVVKDALDEAGIMLGGQSSGEKLPFDERLRRLQKLRDDNHISEQEYENTKKKILESA